MGGIYLFGRRWGISSDDFVFPGISEAIMRSIWWITIVCVYSLNAHVDCKSDTVSITNLHVYIVGFLITNAIDIVFAISIAVISSRGSIRNSLPRRKLVYLLYARIPIFIFEFIWNVVGSSWSFQSFNCSDELIVAARVTSVLGWLLFFVMVIGLFIIFDPLGKISNDRVTMDNHARRMWKRRLQILFLCACKDDNATGAFEDVADIFTGLFSDMDLVITDLWAALLLLVTKEFQVLAPRRKALLSMPTSPPPEWMNLKLAERYMQFASAAYGWPYFVFDSINPRKMIQLLRNIKCCQPCNCQQAITVRDNYCLCNTAAFRLATGVTEQDLCYISFHNQIYESPFVAVIDNQTKANMIVIRGSMSLRDVLTDLCVNDEDLAIDSIFPENNGGPTGEQPVSINSCSNLRVHKGILNNARYIYNILDREKIIFDMFCLHPDYSLVVTGHSLGAGVAAALTLLLQPKYPEIRCFAFSPPGGVVSRAGLEMSQNSTFSIMVGDDVVPRLSIQNVRKLRQDIIEAIDQNDAPKHEILVKGCYRFICGPSVSSGYRDSQVTSYDVETSNNMDRSLTGFQHADSNVPPDMASVRRSSIAPIGDIDELTDNESLDSNPLLGANASGGGGGHDSILRSPTRSQRSYGGITSPSTRSTPTSPMQRAPPSQPLLSPPGGPSRGPLGSDEEEYEVGERVERTSSDASALRQFWTGRPMPKHYCPGRICHITLRDPDAQQVSPSDKADGVYTAKWLHSESLNQLVLSSRMVADHMPYNVLAVMRKVRGELIDGSGTSTTANEG